MVKGFSDWQIGSFPFFNPHRQGPVPSSRR